MSTIATPLSSDGVVIPADSVRLPPIAARVAAYRKRLGLTQAQLAARWGMSVAAISNIEAGRRTTHQGALADLLDAVLG